jgi:hypothetical protein
VASQIKSLLPLGLGDFKKIETGKTESFSLVVDDAARAQIAKVGKLCLVISPAEKGAESAGSRSMLTIDREPEPKI